MDVLERIEGYCILIRALAWDAAQWAAKRERFFARGNLYVAAMLDMRTWTDAPTTVPRAREIICTDYGAAVHV